MGKHEVIISRAECRSFSQNAPPFLKTGQAIMWESMKTYSMILCKYDGNVSFDIVEHLGTHDEDLSYQLLEYLNDFMITAFPCGQPEALMITFYIELVNDREHGVAMFVEYSVTVHRPPSEAPDKRSGQKWDP